MDIRLPSTIGHVRDLLGDITDRHVRADVPLGALLSGGLDSSVPTALGLGDDAAVLAIRHTGAAA